MEPGSHTHLLWTAAKSTPAGKIEPNKITECLTELLKDKDWDKIQKIYHHFNTKQKQTLATQLPYPLEHSPEEQIAAQLIQDHIITDLNYNTVHLLITHYTTRKDDRALLALKRRALGGNLSAVTEIVENNLPITDYDYCQLLKTYNPVVGNKNKNILIRLANLSEHTANQLLESLPNREYRTIQHYLHRTGGTLLLALAGYRTDEQIHAQINTLNTLMGSDLINFLTAYNHLIQKNHKNRRWSKHILEKCQNKHSELQTQHKQTKHLIAAILGQDTFTVYKNNQGITEPVAISKNDLTWWLAWSEALKTNKNWQNHEIIDQHIKQAPETIAADILQSLLKNIAQTGRLLEENPQLLEQSMTYTQTLRTVKWPQEGLSLYVNSSFLTSLWNQAKNKQQLGVRWYLTVCQYNKNTIKKAPAEAIRQAAGDENEQVQKTILVYLNLYEQLDRSGKTHYDLLWPTWNKNIEQLYNVAQTLAKRTI